MLSLDIKLWDCAVSSQFPSHLIICYLSPLPTHLTTSHVYFYLIVWEKHILSFFEITIPGRGSCRWKMVKWQVCLVISSSPHHFLPPPPFLIPPPRNFLLPYLGLASFVSFKMLNIITIFGHKMVRWWSFLPICLPPHHFLMFDFIHFYVQQVYLITWYIEF